MFHAPTSGIRRVALALQVMLDQELEGGGVPGLEVEDLAGDGDGLVDPTEGQFGAAEAAEAGGGVGVLDVELGLDFFCGESGKEEEKKEGCGLRVSWLAAAHWW